MACLQGSFSSWLSPQKTLTKVNFDELLQELGSQISMWLSCLYSTEGMKEAGKRLRCYQHLSSGGHHSILVLFVYSCSSHVLPDCYNVVSSVLSPGSGWPCFFCPWESRCLIYLLKSVPCFRKPQLPGIICSRVVLWGCGAVPPLQSSSQTRLPGEIARLRGDFPLP